VASTSEKATIAEVARESISKRHREAALRIQKRFLQRLAAEYGAKGVKVTSGHYKDLKATMLCKRVLVKIGGKAVKLASLLNPLIESEASLLESNGPLKRL